MFVSHKFRFVYMAPPKTGTTSVRRALEMIGSEIFVWEKQESKRHFCHLPNELSDYYIFATVRHPFARQISRYLENRIEKTPPSQTDFESFTFGKKTCFETSCSGWLNLGEDYVPPQGCIRFKINRILKLERVSEDFHALPFVKNKIDFPFENACKYQDPKIYLTTQMKIHLRHVYKKDFEFGYDPLDIRLL